MSIGTEAGTPPAAREEAPAGALQTNPFAWSLRREIWENRSVWRAPLCAAGFVLLGFTISLFRMTHTLQQISKMPPDAQAAFRAIPFGIAVAAVMVTTLIVGVFYCLGTLYNEHRDRSILFWKSMPVSDATTVLAKAAVPLVVLPAVGFVVIFATELVMLLLDTAGWLATGRDPMALWAQIPLLRIWVLALYGLVTLALWYAPIYAWLLVLSAWARRAPFLWAVLPPLAIVVVEKLAFDTNWFLDQLKWRLGGNLHEAFVALPPHKKGVHMSFEWPVPDPLKFITSPGLWAGLVAAAALLALAVWLRRRREPM
jgi:ABC-2 type transport system permease protein